MTLRILDILDWLDSEGYEYSFVGNRNGEISGFSSLLHYKTGSITWIKSAEKLEEYSRNDSSKVSLACAVEQEGVNSRIENKIIAGNSKEIFFSVVKYFFGEIPKWNMIGEGTIISEEAKVSNTVSIGCNCSIIGDIQIGEHTRIEHNVVIQGPVIIGQNCIIHSGAVIGGDGFGLYFNDNGSIGKVEHYGGVHIEDGVEIGCNSCIDRGTIDDTFIGRNVKIDNLVHIAHNVQINERACIVAGSIICGSALISEGSYVAPGGIIRNQIIVGKNSLVGLGAVVTKDVDEDIVVAGIPAKSIRNIRKDDK